MGKKKARQRRESDPRYMTAERRRRWALERRRDALRAWMRRQYDHETTSPYWDTCIDLRNVERRRRVAEAIGVDQ